MLCIMGPEKIKHFCESLLMVSSGMSLASIGIFFTLFTVLHSFIESKKNELKKIEDEIRFGNESPQQIAEQKFCREYIQSRKGLNMKFFTTIILAVVIYIYTAVLDMAQIDEVLCYKILLVCDGLFGGWLIYVMVMYFKSYFNKIGR